MSILITADELATELDSPRPPVVLDVRWHRDRPDGRGEYLAGHIPGAVYVDLDSDLAAHGEPADDDEVTPAPGDVLLQYGRLRTIDIDDVATFPSCGTLLDARAGERYRGESEPIDPRAGHIPGALSAPTADNVDARGRFLAPEELRDRFRAVGVPESGDVAVYCGSGVTAAHEIVALTIAGYSSTLYPGSWSQWSNHPDRPIAVGTDPA